MFRNPVTDLIIVAVVALLILGPKRLPMLGRSLGQGMREFKEGITGESKGEEDTDRPALTAAAAAAPAPTAPPVATAAEPAAAAPPVASPPPAAPAATPAAPSPSDAETAEAGTAERSA